MSAVLERLSESVWVVRDGDRLLGSLLLSVKEERGRRIKEYTVLSADNKSLGTRLTLVGAKRVLTGEAPPVSPQRRAFVRQERTPLRVAV